MKTVAAALFVLTYALLLVFPKVRAYIALGAAASFVMLGILPAGKVFASVDWNVILMIIGSMGVISLFCESRMPSLLADLIIDRMPDVRWAVISLALFAGAISAVVDNVATVLMVAPVALDVARKLNVSPVPGVIAIAVSSNLQGAATLVGDTTSILLGGYAGLDFLDFFVYRGKPGMFWVVQAGALAALVVLLVLFRRDRQPIKLGEHTEVKDFFPTVLLVAMVALLVAASFIPDKPGATNGVICLALFLAGVARKAYVAWDVKVAWQAPRCVDYFTVALLAGLFVVIAGVTEAGIVDDISRLFLGVSDNVFVIYTLVVWSSVLLSAFIDNIPYVATMLPVASRIAAALGIDPALLYFGLLSGATLGGNLTPIGASASIAALGVLRTAGHEVTPGTFMKISVPFTLAAATAGYILVWLIWS